MRIELNRIKPITYLLLIIFFVLTVIWALSAGAANIPLGRSLKLLFMPWATDNGDTASTIILHARLPRIILALLTGGALSLAGVASQALFRNPLASPYVIGVSNGAALGAVAGIYLTGLLGFYSVPLFSVAAGILVMIFILYVAGNKADFSNCLLLTGIALNAFCSALTAAVLFMSHERLQGIVFWLMGGLWKAGWNGVWMLLAVVIARFCILYILAPELNLLLLGERSAGETGVNVLRTQRIVVVVIAVMSAICISLTGVIGFVGLLVPHIFRILFGADHRKLLPAAFLGGGMFMLVADTLARTIAAPQEIPVGIITSLAGAPFFMWLLLNKQRSWKR
jgi:iron complex transport system permease protein